MAYTAIHRHARISPRKVRSLANLIRGKHADDAFDTLKYMPHRGARMLEKVLKSALANAEDRAAQSIGDLIVVDARVDGGSMMKRIRPMSRGQAFQIKRRSSHITVSLDLPGAAAAAPKKAKAKKKKSVAPKSAAKKSDQAK